MDTIIHMHQDDLDDLLRDVVGAFGVRAQYEMAIEECSELIVELQHMKRGRSRPPKLTEEIVDAYIVLRQLYLMGGQQARDILAAKVQRLRHRVETGKWENGQQNDTYKP